MDIKKWDRRVMDFFFNPCPTLFDLCVCFGVLGVIFARRALQGWYLEFYAIFLVVIGFNYKEKRHFNGSSLTLLCILGLISLLLHSMPPYINIRNISFQYLNFYLMHEGFTYIFFACVLFYIVVTKATNVRLLLFTLPIAMKNWVSVMLYCGQMTPLLAVGVGIFIYLLCKRQTKWAIFVALVGLNIVAWNYKWLMMKFSSRPHVWMELFRFIKNPPYIGSFFIEVFRHDWFNFIVGSGFNKLVVADNMLSIRTWGGNWLFRHNDILSLMAYIGVFAIIPIILFVKELFIRFRGTQFISLLVAVVVLCNIQITFTRPDRVAVILLVLAWCYIEAKKEESNL